MKKEDFYYPSSDGKTQIHAKEWKPDGEPKAILQILHGMVEFIGRYGDFASFLADHGYVVAGNDHLGHGESVTSDDDYGYFGKDGANYVLRDVDRLRLITMEKYPELPYFMLGHSMGSFILRYYLTMYAKGLKGAIIMGTGWEPAAKIKGARALVTALTRIHGDKYKSAFVDAASFGANNKAFKNPRTSMDWLTKDERVVDWYLGEDWCTFKFTLNGYKTLFEFILGSQDKRKMASLPTGLPLYFVSGEEDPVGRNGDGVMNAVRAYLENTPCEVEYKLYEGDRHEILNELDKEQVYEDLLAWLDDKI